MQSDRYCYRRFGRRLFRRVGFFERRARRIQTSHCHLELDFSLLSRCALRGNQTMGDGVSPPDVRSRPMFVVPGRRAATSMPRRHPSSAIVKMYTWKLVTYLHARSFLTWSSCAETDQIGLTGSRSYTGAPRQQRETSFVGTGPTSCR